MLAMKAHGYLYAPNYLAAPREPIAVGVGPDAAAMAVWPAPGGRQGVLVTSHRGSGPPSRQNEARTSLQARFVQPTRCP